MMSENNNNGQPEHAWLQEGSSLTATGDASNQMETNTSSSLNVVSNDTGQEKSSISVVFTDWVPAESSPFEESHKSSNQENTLVYGANATRYFHVHSGRGKVRPGLGTNPEDYASKPKNRKRKKSTMDLLFEGNINKRFKITPEKTAAAILHEINPNLQYNYQEIHVEGSKSMPSFTCSVVFPLVNGTEFIGEGRSKKQAKNDAAEKVLATLGLEIPPKEAEGQNIALTSTDTVPELESESAFGTPPVFVPPSFPVQPQALMSSNDYDFSSDDIINVNFTTPCVPMLSQPAMVDAGVYRRLRNIPNIEENICLALNTIVIPNIVDYEYLGEDGPPHDKVFTFKLLFNMQEYLGKGGSKKKAKADAAKKAVITLLGEDFYKNLVQQSSTTASSSDQSPSSPTTGKPKAKKGKKKKSKQALLPSDHNTPEEPLQDEDEDDSDDWEEFDLNFSDHVSNLVREKYEELMGKDANFSPYKVLAGVILTTASPMIYNSSVIAVTTGTKCIEGDFMSEQGLSVNDCHAEILATRCVRDYLYSQIELFEFAKSDSERLECILEENPLPDSRFKYQLKCGVKFHLYISTSPCGDARIFSPKGIELEEEEQASPTLEDAHPNKLNRGVLRSKIEAGEGTIPSANLEGQQTWDSIVCGNALKTMSCSDKVCRWNVLGFQGALLYNFLGTVFYSSITLGSLHHPVHFKRAVYGRIENLNFHLDVPFQVNKPKLMMVSRKEKRKVKKSPNHAVCWTIDWSTPEILAANKGRCDGGVASRLTKRMSFSRFLKLYKNQTGRRDNYADLTYHEAKQVAADYQKAKKDFADFFKTSNLGPWIGKPLEQDSFKIT